jgi:hypothetical protein
MDLIGFFLLGLRRVFKVLEFDFELTSALVCFGNRFLISTVIENVTDLKIFILDLGKIGNLPPKTVF